MQFMKHVLPRLIRPLKPKVERDREAERPREREREREREKVNNGLKKRMQIK